VAEDPEAEPDPHEVVIVEQDAELCPRCGAPDSIVYEHHPVAGARSSLTTRGTCEKCGATVPGPVKTPELREMPQQVPRDDFGRRRRGWWVTGNSAVTLIQVKANHQVTRKWECQ
jgi:ribosomal protein S27AE